MTREPMSAAQALDELAVAAARYAMSRKTYIYHFTVAALMDQRGALSENTRHVLVRDIDRRLEEGFDDAEMEREWRELRQVLAAD